MLGFYEGLFSGTFDLCENVGRPIGDSLSITSCRVSRCSGV